MIKIARDLYFEPEKYQGLRIYYKRFSNLAFAKFLEERQTKERDILYPSVIKNFDDLEKMIDDAVINGMTKEDAEIIKGNYKLTLARLSLSGLIRGIELGEVQFEQMIEHIQRIEGMVYVECDGKERAWTAREFVMEFPDTEIISELYSKMVSTSRLDGEEIKNWSTRSTSKSSKDQEKEMEAALIPIAQDVQENVATP